MITAASVMLIIAVVFVLVGRIKMSRAKHMPTGTLGSWHARAVALDNAACWVLVGAIMVIASLVCIIWSVAVSHI